LRLQEILSRLTGLSRRKSTQAILDGRVRIDGEVERYPRRELDPQSSSIEFDGKSLEFKKQATVVYLINKPAGYLSAMTDDRGRKTLSDLIAGKIEERVFHVGRLDQGTSGLLILTNDGELAHLVSHPASEIEKAYLVKIRGKLDDIQLQAIRDGITLEDGFTTSPARVSIARSDRDTTTLRLILHEGHKREIREMFKALGKSVVSLVRVSIGGLDISIVPRPGEIKKLGKKEIDLIKQGSKRKNQGR
jgi:23S rRNA pseudouridine2605 synthase